MEIPSSKLENGKPKPALSIGPRVSNSQFPAPSIDLGFGVWTLKFRISNLKLPFC